MPTVQIKYSVTSGNEPSGLLPGQLAINLADNVLFWMDSGNVLRSYSFLDPVAPTLSTSDESDAVATTSFVHGVFDQLVGGGTLPSGLNTIAKIVSAINGDANFWQTVLNSLAVMIRYDQAQGLNATAQKQAQANLGLPSAVINGGSF